MVSSEKYVMKVSLSLGLVCAALFIAACTDYEDQSQRGVRHPVAKYPAQGQQAAPGQQPFNPNAPSQEAAAAQEETSTAPSPPPAPGKVAKGDFPYGKPVPGKPHLVESPFSPGKYIDVEGFAPGTEVKDPYTGKIFLVP
jgi:hypothetical protein